MGAHHAHHAHQLPPKTLKDLRRRTGQAKQSKGGKYHVPKFSFGTGAYWVRKPPYDDPPKGASTSTAHTDELWLAFTTWLKHFWIAIALGGVAGFWIGVLL